MHAGACVERHDLTPAPLGLNAGRRQNTAAGAPRHGGDGAVAGGQGPTADCFLPLHLLTSGGFHGTARWSSCPSVEVTYTGPPENMADCLRNTWRRWRAHSSTKTRFSSSTSTAMGPWNGFSRASRPWALARPLTITGSSSTRSLPHLDSVASPASWVIKLPSASNTCRRSFLKSVT